MQNGKGASGGSAVDHRLLCLGVGRLVQRQAVLFQLHGHGLASSICDRSGMSSIKGMR